MQVRKPFLIGAALCVFSTATADTSTTNTAVPTLDGNLAVLGNGVATPLQNAAPLSDASAVFTARKGTFYYQITYGSGAGTSVSESLDELSPGIQQIWRRLGAPGHQTDFSVSPTAVLKTGMTDPDHQLLFQYTPGEPEVIAGMIPGENRRFSYSVNVVKTTAPSQTQASGQIDVVFTYMGGYQIETAEGAIATHGFSKQLTGKVGPTLINTSLFVFYAEGIGEVARIDHTDVRALLLYNRDSRTGYLMNKQSVFSTP